MLSSVSDSLCFTSPNLEGQQGFVSSHINVQDNTSTFQTSPVGNSFEISVWIFTLLFLHQFFFLPFFYHLLGESFLQLMLSLPWRQAMTGAFGKSVRYCQKLCMKRGADKGGGDNVGGGCWGRRGYRCYEKKREVHWQALSRDVAEFFFCFVAPPLLHPSPPSSSRYRQRVCKN